MKQTDSPTQAKATWSENPDVQTDMKAAKAFYEHRADLEFRGLGPSRDIAASVQRQLERLIACVPPAKR